MTASHLIGLADVLDINDNGRLGWPDLLAWVFFGTVGLLGVAVVAGMAFGGVAVAVRGVRRVAGTVWTGIRRYDPAAGHLTFASWSVRSEGRGERVGSASAWARRHRADAPGHR